MRPPIVPVSRENGIVKPETAVVGALLESGSLMPAPLDVLHATFHLQAFRPGQEAVVEAQLEGRDVLSVAPTGSGKSISYWVPALLTTGTTVVVSPLIALMKDQVDRLRSLGVEAAFVNSTLQRWEQEEVLAGAEAGRVRLLYVAPERFARPGFAERLRALRPARFVVDEAHCISTWGHDFRPDYRLLGGAIEASGRPPISAFTATATPQVRQDIVRSLGLREPLISVTGFHRENLRLAARRLRNDEEKVRFLLGRLDRVPGRCLVYCATVRGTEEVAAQLREAGHEAAAYHAQLDEGPRRQVQEDFSGGGLRVVAATLAFGMGVDIPDIRQVIHYHLPSSLEGYYQEAGRAGRDGDPASCILLWRPGDRDIQTFLLDKTAEEAGGGPEVEERRRHGYARLQQMESYARLRTCRHARIADYFGEEGVARTCEACDNCLSGREDHEEAVDPAIVRSALEAVSRFRLGSANLAAILAGTDTKWVRAHGWALETPQFGSLRGWPVERIRTLIGELVDTGLARLSPGDYPTLLMTEDGRQVLEEAAVPEVTLPPAPPPARSSRRDGGAAALTGDDALLMERLRAWRSGLARAQQVPAYVILPDRALAALAVHRPRDRSALLAVPGIGEAKLTRYGADLLRLIAGDA
jgi:ATP-dependent DNA helicase RecQ